MTNYHHITSMANSLELVTLNQTSITLPPHCTCPFTQQPKFNSLHTNNPSFNTIVLTLNHLLPVQTCHEPRTMQHLLTSRPQKKPSIANPLPAHRANPNLSFQNFKVTRPDPTIDQDLVGGGGRTEELSVREKPSRTSESKVKRSRGPQGPDGARGGCICGWVRCVLRGVKNGS